MDLTTPRNRRQSNSRVAKQVPVSYSTDWTTYEAMTLNVSDSGARLVVRSSLPKRFQMQLGPVAVKAETVWEQPLGSGTRVVGVRFARNQQVGDWLLR